ncbi:MAG: Rrf2 family transcriptional regulator [Planctomycetales bacterium]
MISQAVECSLRAMVTLAHRVGQPSTCDEIAEFTRVPRPYLSKIMRGLVREGLVESQRGRKGGFVLSRPPEEINVWDVVQAVAPLQRIHSCPLGLSSHKDSMCRLHQRLDDAIAEVEKVFRDSTLADLLQGQVVPLCEERPSSMVQLEMPSKKKK